MRIVSKVEKKKKGSFDVKAHDYFYSHGKILLTGEYFVLDGTKSIALPIKWGQSLSVKYVHSFEPTLSWKGYDYQENLWFDTKFECWHFNFVDQDRTPKKEELLLQKILRQARVQNPHFLERVLMFMLRQISNFLLVGGLDQVQHFFLILLSGLMLALLNFCLIPLKAQVMMWLVLNRKALSFMKDIEMVQNGKFSLLTHFLKTSCILFILERSRIQKNQLKNSLI